MDPAVAAYLQHLYDTRAGNSPAPAAVPAANPFGGGTTNSGAVTPTTLDKLFGISTDYAGLPQSASFSVVPGQQFNVPDNNLAGIGDTTGMDTQGLLSHLQNLPPDELRVVQAELANAGYYGNITKMQDEPTWGVLGTKDVAAFRTFVVDGIAAAQNGQTLTSLLALKTQQFTAVMSHGTSTTPIFNLGTDYTVEHLDQTQVNSEADKAALAVLGHGLTDQERSQVYAQMDANGVNQQQMLNAGKQARALADATAKANLTIDPTTGQPIAFNGIDATARSYLGKIKYQWGGTNPATGLDCSAFTQFVYQQNGLAIGRTTSDQWANPAGTQVSADAAQPGDLVFFGSPTDNGNAHVGVYIGNGMMIDNLHSGTSTEIDSINGAGLPILGFKHFNVPTSGSGAPALTSASTAATSGTMGLGAIPAGAPVDVGGMSIPQDAAGQSPAQAAGTGGPLAAGQKPIISTPDTTFQTTQQDVPSQVADMIRKMHPDQAAAHDFSNAYDQFLSIMKGH